MADFEVIKHLGKGAFGQVLEVRWAVLYERVCVTCERVCVTWLQVLEKRTQKSYALKVIRDDVQRYQLCCCCR